METSRVGIHLMSSTIENPLLYIRKRKFDFCVKCERDGKLTFEHSRVPHMKLCRACCDELGLTIEPINAQTAKMTAPWVEAAKALGYA